MDPLLNRPPTVPVAATSFTPEPHRAYLVFCPDSGEWHVGSWWTLDGPGRWVLTFDTMVELTVSHVVELPGSPLGPADLAIWKTTLATPPAGSA